MRPQLWRLLEDLHEAGWWHCDVCLINVVVTDDGRPLLIDWENARPATAAESFDLWGTTVGAQSEWAIAVHWFNQCRQCPSWYWGAVGSH